MKIRGTLLTGFLYGFLFGTVGMFILASLSLMLQSVEFATAPLFALGRFAAQFLEEDGSGSTLDAVLLILLNGVFYGLVGTAIQMLWRSMTRTRA